MAATIGSITLRAGVIMALTALAAASEMTCSKTSPAKSVGLMQLQARAAMPEISQFGNPKCPCIGLSNISGTTVVVHGTTKVQYPADVGAHCAAWDHGQEPFEKSEYPRPYNRLQDKLVDKSGQPVPPLVCYRAFKALPLQGPCPLLKS